MFIIGIAAAVIIGNIVMGEISVSSLAVLGLAVAYGAVGLVDDYAKIKKKENAGLTPQQKLVLDVYKRQTFHSLEDRIVKAAFQQAAQGCTCPKDFPVCICGKKPKVRLTPRKPILPDEREIEENPRARSAKLRVCEKI